MPAVPTQFGPHESLELREVLRMEATGATKLKAALPMVSDPELKQFMQQSMQTKLARVQRMREFAQAPVH